MKKGILWTEAYAADLIEFYQRAIQTRSYSDEEGDMARLMEREMKDLGFDKVYIDPVGNAVGRVGDGPKIIHFDSHMDNVQVNDPEDWQVPPFSAEMAEGMVYGRGSVDMKGGLAASVYAAALAKRSGLLEGKNTATASAWNTFIGTAA